MNLIERFLDFDYWVTGRLVPRGLITRFAYSLSRVSRPKFAVRAWLNFWIRQYSIDMDEYVVPDGGFKTFNEFHVRDLKPGRRRIASSGVVFPCDCTITAMGKISDNGRIDVKGNRYHIGELVTNCNPELGDAWQDEYREGSFFVLYLPVNKYHWWHSPVNGVLSQCVVHSGELFTVTEKAQRRNPKLFKKNHRLAEWYECDGKAAGIVVGVATTLVGTILSTYQRPERGVSTPRVVVEKGVKVGGFCFGSAVVLLLPACVTVSDAIVVGGQYDLGMALGEFRRDST